MSKHTTFNLILIWTWYGAPYRYGMDHSVIIVLNSSKVFDFDVLSQEVLIQRHKDSEVVFVLKTPWNLVVLQTVADGVKSVKPAQTSKNLDFCRKKPTKDCKFLLIALNVWYTKNFFMLFLCCISLVTLNIAVYLHFNEKKNESSVVFY